MKRSRERILTKPVGSMTRPMELEALLVSQKEVKQSKLMYLQKKRKGLCLPG